MPITRRAPGELVEAIERQRHAEAPGEREEMDARRSSPPPSAISSVIALSSDAAVRIRAGASRCPRQRDGARVPVSSAARVRAASTAGIVAVPGRHMPSASTSAVIVDAVPSSLQ